MGFKKALILADIHCPYHDPNIINKICELIKREKFDEIYLLGDILDCVSISKFPKPPDRYDYLDEELNEAMLLLAQFRVAAETIPIKYILGNHEIRMQKYLWTRARPLAKLKSLQLDELLKTKAVGINIFTENIWLNKNFLLKHGTRTGENPSRGELLAHGVSGMSGHAHKSNKSRKNFFGKPVIWYSIGHLCDVSKLDYAKDFSYTWNHGFAIIEYNNDLFNVTEIDNIVNGSFFYNNVKY